jgi:hypothetical protein
MVKQDHQGPATCVRANCPKLKWRCCERTVVSSKVVERDILGVDKSQVFQVRVGEPPAAPLVDPSAVRKNARERTLGLDLADAFDLRIEHPLLPPLPIAGGESQYRLQTPPEFVLG